MLGTLLESSAPKQRRSGGAIASVVVHVGIIGAVVVGTAAGRPAPRTIEKPVIIPVLVPETKAKIVPRTEASSTTPKLPTNVVTRIVEVPLTIPIGIPEPNLTAGPPVENIEFGPAGSGGLKGPITIVDGEKNGGKSEWGVNEVLMNVITPAKPRYPESLRSAGIDGRVLVQFTVDTTGRVDMNSVKILSSTHDLFSRAVRDALGNFRFRPAEVGGHRVNALAEMPFEFQITR